MYFFKRVRNIFLVLSGSFTTHIKMYLSVNFILLGHRSFIFKEFMRDIYSVTVKPNENKDIFLKLS